MLNRLDFGITYVAEYYKVWNTICTFCLFLIFVFSFQGAKQRMPFSLISTWLISTSLTRWGSAASVEWSWYEATSLYNDKKLLGYFFVHVEVKAGPSSVQVFPPLSPANRYNSRARRTKRLPWRSWRSGTSWTPGSRSTSAQRSSSCRRRTLTSS